LDECHCLDILSGLKAEDSSSGGVMPWVADDFTAGVSIHDAHSEQPADVSRTAAD
jgi:hypothetical protein